MNLVKAWLAIPFWQRVLGSLAGGALAGWPTRLAPAGGTLMMLGWLGWAVSALRGR
ncbi:hypothetical protein L613_007400000040 [Pseudoxanthomonas taiwanensis J19]|uniref:Uncharacterized protein n=1 Tax=Pseudoxanthomonas taiwanensis J19 TaxID=935569 RepID=A0A562D3N5_9GAMM|nr:hypothetical protein L613_007400000040 [Pseudoxanthomonas taiwanensis J19]